MKNKVATHYHKMPKLCLYFPFKIKMVHKSSILTRIDNKDITLRYFMCTVKRGEKVQFPSRKCYAFLVVFGSVVFRVKF